MYLRKSRKDEESRLSSESDEDTLVRHEKTLWELAQHQGLSIAHIYREVVSGDTIDARPVMQQLLKEVEMGMWTGVLVVEVERLARGDTSDQGRIAQAFKFSETLIITPNKTYDPTNEFDEEYFEFGLFMSRRELKVITRRLQEGRKRSVLEGKFLGNVAPYGFERIKLLKEKGFTLRELAEEADVVRMIFEWYTVGELQADGTNKRLGISLIVKRLNQLKIPPSKGDKWTISSIRDMLINPTYIGKIRWNYRQSNKKMINGEIVISRPRSEDYIIADGLHKGIIRAQVFETAQKFMKENPARPVGERKTVKNPLTGLIECGMCGRKMVRRPYRNGYPDTLMCPVADCKNVSSHLNLVEEKVLESLKDWLSGYRLRWEVEENPKKSKNLALEIKRKSLRKLDKEIVRLKEQQSSLDDLLEQGVYTIEKYKQRSHELEKRMLQSEDSYKKLQEEIVAEEAREESRKLIIVPKVEKLLETYYALATPEAKNDLLKEVLEKVIYSKTKNGRRSPDKFDITLFPKLPRSNP